MNMVLPPLCCSALPWGPFVSIVNETVDFLVPQFLAAALASPSCRDDLLARTQNSFSYLQATQQRVSVHVYEGSGEETNRKKRRQTEKKKNFFLQKSKKGKISYCPDSCLPDGVIQINLFLTSACLPYCPTIVV